MTILEKLRAHLRPKRASEAKAHRRLWIRLGVSLYITEAEETAIFANDGGAEDVVRKIVAEGRFALDGDSYIPGVTVEEYNQKHGTDYEVRDTDFDF